MGKRQQVLIQCGDHFENQCRVSLLTLSLQQLGHEPVVLLYSRGHGDIFRRLGVKTLFLQDYLRRSAKTRRISNRSPIVQGISTQDLIAVEGRRRPRITWPGQQEKTRLDAQRYLRAIDLLLDDLKPQRVAVWNGYTGYAANALRLLSQSRGLKTAFMERGFRADSLFIDRDGVNGGSSLSRFDAASTPMPDPNTLRSLHDYFPGLSLERRSELTGTARLFFPMQVELDTNILLYSPLSTMRQAFLSAFDLFGNDPSEFVIRPHPEEVPGHRLNIPRFANVSVSSDGSLPDQITAADLVITINSTVGLEALIQGKPVCAFGESIYSAICQGAEPGKSPMDYAVDLDVLQKYLHVLSSQNLLIEGKASNQEAVMAQLDLPAISPASCLTRKTRLDQVHSLTEKRDRKDELIVDMLVSPSKQLNLTYRKNQQALDLLSLKKQLFPRDDPTSIRIRERSDKLPPGDVLVVDEGWQGASDGYLAIVNCYGVVLSTVDE